MDDWKEYKFSEIASFISEKINISDITTDFYISTDNMIPNFGGIFPAEKLPQASKCNSFKKYDILFSNIRTYFKKIWLATFSGGCSADVLVIRSKDENLILQKYLYLLICSPDFINFTIASSNGAKMPRGDKNAMLNYTLLVPPISYQKKAINLYLKFNAKIELNTQTNQTLEAIAQAIFKHWFIDFAPVHAKADALAAGKTAEQAELAAMTSISGKTEAEIIKLANSDPQAYQQLQQTAAAFPSEFVESEMGLVPKGWEKCSITDKKICEMLKPKIEPFTGEKDYIATANVSKNSIVGTLEKITFDNRPSRANMQPIIDSIWFAKMVGEHKAIMIDRADEFLLNHTILSTGFLGIKPKQYKKCFLYCFINSPYFIQFKNSLATGAVQIALNNSSFSAIEIILPNNKVLQFFEKNLNNIFSKISSNNRENKTLAQTRDALLPKLLNGEIAL